MKKIIMIAFTVALLAAILGVVTGGTFIQDVYDWAIKLIETQFNLNN